jgi:hypothetical protein
VIGYSQDEYTIAASTTDFIRVRMRVGTVAALARNKRTNTYVLL